MTIKHLLSPLPKLVSQDSLIKWTGRNTIFPYYHTISDVDLPYISNLYKQRSIGQFKQDLDYFCKYFEPVDLVEVKGRAFSNADNFKPAFHLTFDDGLKEIYSIIAPILEERNIPATFFLNTDFIDNKGLFYRYKVALIIEKIKTSTEAELIQKVRSILIDEDKWVTNVNSSLLNLTYQDVWLIDTISKSIELDFNLWLEQNKPYLNKTQIRDLIDRGFHIGSHSKDHPRFKHISFDQQKQQIEGSFKLLEESFNIRERLFSFPFGDEEVKLDFFNWMYQAAGCELSFGVSGIKDDEFPNHLHRIPMDLCDIEVDRFIKSEYLYFILKSIFNKNKIARQ